MGAQAADRHGDRHDADQRGPADQIRQGLVTREQGNDQGRADQIRREQEQRQMAPRIELFGSDPRPLRGIGAVANPIVSESRVWSGATVTPETVRC
jgi:hypothetical protein